MNLVDAIGQFLDTCVADGLKRGTLIWYEGKLKTLGARFGDREIEDMTVADMRSYVRGLHEREHRYIDRPRKRPEKGGLSVESIRGHIRFLRRFWSWAQREYKLDANPMDKIKMPPAPKPVPKAIKPEDIVALLNMCDDSPIGRRDCAVIAFLTDTGCRAAGILGLKDRDVDLENRRATVFEKFDKGRIVGFSEYTRDRIVEWLALRPVDAETLFCSLGNNTTGEALTSSGLHRILKRKAKLGRIDGRINPHSFRHSFARRYLLAGGDISSLSKVLGHSSTALTSEVYGTFLNEEALKRYEELHLMDRLLKKKNGNEPSTD